MSRNYIKALLEPFRESKVVEALLKLLAPGSISASGGSHGRGNKVNIIFLLISSGWFLRG